MKNNFLMNMANRRPGFSAQKMFYKISLSEMLLDMLQDDQQKSVKGKICETLCGPQV
jgi:hypothetical protein